MQSGDYKTFLFPVIQNLNYTINCLKLLDTFNQSNASYAYSIWELLVNLCTDLIRRIHKVKHQNNVLIGDKRYYVTN